MSTSRPVDVTAAALAAARSIRSANGFGALSGSERAALERDLDKIEQALSGSRARAPADPFAIPLETPLDLMGPAAGRSPPPGGGGLPPAPPGRPPAANQARQPAGTEVIGTRARRVLDAVDFPSFVAGLIHGTFQSIVDATAQQVREYAKLVADLSKSVDAFTRDNVSPNQARDALVGKHPQELELVLPRPGQPGEPRVVPRRQAVGTSPAWLADYGLDGEELTPELVEGALIQAARQSAGEDRLRTLATLVLMGVNRVVVEDGQLRARLQFHAKAQESVRAEVIAQTGGQDMGIAAQTAGLRTAVATMVSTVDVNAQADVSIKADLVGEVQVRFRTETFDLTRFADSQAIALITRHAGQQAAQGAQPGPAATAPAPAPGGGAAPAQNPAGVGAPR